MHETALAHIDARVRGYASSAKQHQVPGAEVFGVDQLSETAQLRHAAWGRNAQLVAIHVADQATAIESSLRRVAAITVRRADQAQRMDSQVTGLIGRQSGRRSPRWRIASRRRCAGATCEQQRGDENGRAGKSGAHSSRLTDALRARRYGQDLSRANRQSRTAASPKRAPSLRLTLTFSYVMTARIAITSMY